MEIVVKPQFTPQQIELIKTQICKGATDDELKMFIFTCERLQLDPFARQVFSIARKDGANTIRSTMISIDGFRVIAERSGKYLGQTAPEWCGEDGVWKSVWTSKNNPFASRCGVYKHPFTHPIYAVAHFSSYSQPYSPLWKKMPAEMLHKCAESLALRRAFPNELGGQYTDVEMNQAEMIELSQRVIDTKKICDSIGIVFPVEKARLFYKEKNANALSKLLDEYDELASLRVLETKEETK
jgi:phage recombination protein Bet